MNGVQTRASLYKNRCDKSNLIDEWEQPEVNIWIALGNTVDRGRRSKVGAKVSLLGTNA